MLKTADFFYDLPPELIAQAPSNNRGESRLLVFNREFAETSHRRFSNIVDYLRAGDLMVVNNSKVIPARLRGTKISGGGLEVLLLEEVERNEWWVMLKPGKRTPVGTVFTILDREQKSTLVQAEVKEKSPAGHYRLQFRGVENIKDELGRLGEVPLPPYIQRPSGTTAQDQDRYQTVFAKPPGSVAAPTAGLHFTPEIVEKIRSIGVDFAEVTLHVGSGTFAPVKAETLDKHEMHEERYEVSPATAAQVANAKARGGRIFAVGTTSLRVLESVGADGSVKSSSGRTKLFVYPPYRFNVADALLTNFHLPESTLLMLVSAFAAPGRTTGRDLIMTAYREAIRERYRFFSFGDAMLIL